MILHPKDHASGKFLWMHVIKMCHLHLCYYTHLTGKLVLMICMFLLRHECGFSCLLKPYRMEHWQCLSFPLNSLYKDEERYRRFWCYLQQHQFQNPSVLPLLLCPCHLWVCFFMGTASWVCTIICFHQSFLRACLMWYFWFLYCLSIIFPWSLMAHCSSNQSQWFPQLTVFSSWLIVYSPRTTCLPSTTCLG